MVHVYEYSCIVVVVAAVAPLFWHVVFYCCFAFVISVFIGVNIRLGEALLGDQNL